MIFIDFSLIFNEFYLILHIFVEFHIDLWSLEAWEPGVLGVWGGGFIEI